MTKPDLKRAALLAACAAFAYDLGLNTISLDVARAGFNFVTVIESPGFQAVVMTNSDTGEQLVDCRGTPVTCARDIVDWFRAVDADIAFDMLDLDEGARVLRAPYQLVLDNWPRLKAVLDLTKPIIVVGHSLGAVLALIIAHRLAARRIAVRGAVFAPFQFANGRFHQQIAEAGSAIDLFGRARDFAPGWNHVDPRTVLAPMWHIDGAELELVTRWPLYRESVADHSVTSYSADLAALSAEPSLVPA